jgi:hypothetical protein
VVLGGSFSTLGEVLREPLQEGLRARVITARWSPPDVVVAAQERGPAATGGAFARLNQVLADPAAWLLGRAASGMA